MICEAAYDKKADDIVVMEMKRRTALCDFFVVMSAPSQVRVRAIVDAVEGSMEGEGYRAAHKEGYREAVWVLLDYGSVIVHVFYHETRRFYDLEHLWGDAPRKNYNAAH